MKKWIVLAAGVVMQSILGGIYAWSAFVPQLTSNYDLSKGQCGAIFGLTIAVFALAMIPAGRLLSKKGPRITAIIGALLFAAGYILASFSEGNFVYLLLSYGVLVGTGIGFGYVCPLTTGMKWFPDNRGLVTGVAVAGFGGGAIILSSLAEYLMVSQNYSVMQVFFFTGLVFGLLALLSAAFMSEPPKDEAKQTSQNKLAASNDIFSGQFLLIFIGMFAGTFAGLLIVGNLKPLMLAQDLSEFYATLSISLFAVGNILGRVLWGQVHDRLQSRKAVLFCFIFFLVALFLLLLKGPTWMALASTILVGAAFGGCFVIYASTIVEKYGVEKFSKLYPICFLAYGLAALVGPPLGGWLADRTGSYASGLYTSIGVLVVVGLLFTIFFQKESQAELEAEETYA